ncbi:unnamed protein product [Prorocentrum cordatum]|uniref:Uncharacterized protein n=1 Tax=Prorocentrum cordatum TaxID=2364126 RepID=A0ABN9SU51_9DINO|nr:unnamed protein product [Polarella glacialis]
MARRPRKGAGGKKELNAPGLVEAGHLLQCSGCKDRLPYDMFHKKQQKASLTERSCKKCLEQAEQRLRMAKCTRCEQELDRESFNKRVDWDAPVCKVCLEEQDRLAYEAATEQWNKQMEQKWLEQESMDEEALQGQFNELLRRGASIPPSHAEASLPAAAQRLWELAACWAERIAERVEREMKPGSKLHHFKHPAASGIFCHRATSVPARHVRADTAADWCVETPSRDHASDKVAADKFKALEDEGDRLVYAFTDRIVQRHIAHEERRTIAVRDLLEQTHESRSGRSCVMGRRVVVSLRPVQPGRWPEGHGLREDPAESGLPGDSGSRFMQLDGETRSVLGQLLSAKSQVELKLVDKEFWYGLEEHNYGSEGASDRGSHNQILSSYARVCGGAGQGANRTETMNLVADLLGFNDEFRADTQWAKKKEANVAEALVGALEAAELSELALAAVTLCFVCSVVWPQGVLPSNWYMAEKVLIQLPPANPPLCYGPGKGEATTTTITTSKPYDCAEGFSQWTTQWPDDKRKWCCVYENKACEDVSAASEIEEGWSAEKREWCCLRHEKGCNTAKSLAPLYDCTEANETQEQWPDIQKAWCCKAFRVACPKILQAVTRERTVLAVVLGALAVVIAALAPPPLLVTRVESRTWSPRSLISLISMHQSLLPLMTDHPLLHRALKLNPTLGKFLVALLDGCLQQASAALAETSRVQLASCQAQLVGMFQVQQEHVAKTLAVHARDVAKVGERADALAEEQRRMRAQISDIEKTLAMAEKEIPIIDFQLVGPAQLRAGIADWLTAAGLDNNMVRLDVNVPSKRFNVVVEGGLDVAIPRAQALARHLRNPATPNGWRTFQCQAVGGGIVPLYVSPDKLPQQVRMEIQTRRLANILGDAVPGHAFSAQRARGIITSQGARLAKLEIGERREVDTTIRWNMGMASRLAIDRDAIAEQFNQAFSLEDRTEWGLLHSNPRMRRRKVAFLSSHMRAGAVILIQEVHGSEDALKVFCQRQPQRDLFSLTAGPPPRRGWRCLPGPAVGGAAPSCAARALSFDIVVPGRVALLSVSDPLAQRSRKILNAHNFDLSADDFAAAEQSWRDGLAWAAGNHLRPIFIGAGDFNIAGRPTVSQRYPAAGGAWRLRPDQRCQLRQPAWRRLSGAALEVEAQWPTRYDKASQQLSVIDRIFLGIDAHAMISVSARLTTACGAMEMSERGLSDHAPLVLQIEMARHVPREEQAIPSHLFFHPKYREMFSLMVANCDLEMATVEGRWRATKTCMKLASRRVRDGQLRATSSLKVKDGNAETTRMGFKTAARALWRQDAPLAARLLASCPALASHLLIDRGAEGVADSRAFGDTFDAVAAMVHALRRQAAEAAARRASDRGGPAWRRAERRAAPRLRALRLRRFRECSAGIAGMAGAVAEHWGKIFERAPTAEQKQRLSEFLDRYAPQRLVVELPQPSLHALERAAARAPPSAPGPDQLPRAALRRSPDALRHPHALMERLFNEGVGPHDLNWSIFHCAPKGAEVEGALRPRRIDGPPMLLSYNFRHAFPSLFHDPRFGAPLGLRSVASALCCNCLAFSSFRASGASAALEPLFALRCGIAQGCPLSGTVWCLGMGRRTACADDLGMLIRNARVLPPIASSFADIEFAFNLQLAIHECALVPLWVEVTLNLICETKEYLAELVPRWSGFRIDSSDKYLGTGIGPGVSEPGIWKDAAAKCWPRASELSRAGMATSLAAIAYNVKVLPCLSCLAQLFFLIPEIWRVEFTLLHRLLRFPPSSMRKADILSMGAWCGSLAPLGLLPYSVGALLRAAANAVRDWVPTLHALHDTAVEHLPMARVLLGSWCPSWWATGRSIVQNCGLVMDLFSALPHPRPVFDKVPVPVPSPLIDAACRAMRAEEMATAQADPPRKVKRQAVAMRTLRDGFYADRVDQLIGRRLRRRGLEVPAEKLRVRWLELRAELRVAHPARLWSWLRTVVNGWITSGRMRVIAPRPCLMGCDARGDLSRYMVCPVLRGAVAAPAEPSEMGSGTVFLGLGHQLEHRMRPHMACVRAVALATQLFHILMWRAGCSLPIHAAAVAAYACSIASFTGVALIVSDLCRHCAAGTAAQALFALAHVPLVGALGLMALPEAEVRDYYPFGSILAELVKAAQHALASRIPCLASPASSAVLAIYVRVRRARPNSTPDRTLFAALPQGHEWPRERLRRAAPRTPEEWPRGGATERRCWKATGARIAATLRTPCDLVSGPGVGLAGFQAKVEAVSRPQQFKVTFGTC